MLHNSTLFSHSGPRKHCETFDCYCSPWLLPPMHLLHGRIIIILMHLVASVAAVLGNALISLAIFMNHHLRTCTHYFILSLSITDAIVGMIGQPLFVYVVWMRGKVPCALLFTQYWFGSVACGASALLLCVVSIERYLSICRPFQHVRIFTSNRTTGLIVNAWCLSIVLTSSAFSNVNRLVYNVILLGSFLVVLLVIVPCYTAIYLTAAKQIRQVEGGISREESRERRKQRRSSFTIMYVVIGFLFCWVTYFICSFLWSFNIIKNNSNDVLVTAYYFGLTLGFCNSSMNPFLYTFNSRDLKNGIRIVLDRLHITWLFRICCHINRVRNSNELYTDSAAVVSVAKTNVLKMEHRASTFER